MIIDHIRDLEEFKRLYNDRPMPNPYDFDFIINNPLLFCFYDEITNKLLGFITLQKEFIKLLNKNVLTLSGVSIKKNMPNIITAIIKICSVINDDIYSVTPLKEAKLVLCKAGFKKISNNIYMRCNNG